MSDEEKKDAPQATEEPSTEEAAPEEKAPEAPAEAEEKKEDASSEEPPAEAEAPTEEAPAKPEEPAYKAKLDDTLDELKSGMTVRVHEKIKDVNPKGEERERVQVFEGIILGLRGGGISRTMTIRKVSNGIGVEKIYPINSPVIDKIELVKSAKVRQAKLGYLKNPKRRFKRKLKESHVDQA